jgi:hypothetical protein
LINVRERCNRDDHVLRLVGIKLCCCSHAGLRKDRDLALLAR